MKDVTIVITAFDRPDSLKNCVASIRDFYPDVNIIISDNGHVHKNSQETLKKNYGCEYIQLPYDCGANRARSAGFAASRTEYTMIMEDDMEFTRETQIDKFKIILDKNPWIGLIGGIVQKGEKKGIIGSELIIDPKNKTFFRNALTDPPLLNCYTIKYYFCDYVRMFFMKRRKMPFDFEETIYPDGSGSHLSIFLKIKTSGSHWKIAFTHEVVVLHHRERGDPEYKALRLGRRDVFKKRFHKNTGFRFGVFNHQRVIDYKENRKLSYEEYLNLEKIG